MNIPSSLKYTPNDEWILVEGNTGKVGITDYAQNQLSDIVYVEVVVSVCETVKKGDACATVESVKAASDLYAPLAGEVVAVNDALPGAPEHANQDAYAAWMFRVRPSNPAELNALLDAAAYEKVVASEEH
jgi:glycine cleavage system H protein